LELCSFLLEHSIRMKLAATRWDPAVLRQHFLNQANGTARMYYGGRGSRRILGGRTPSGYTIVKQSTPTVKLVTPTAMAAEQAKAKLLPANSSKYPIREQKRRKTMNNNNRKKSTKAGPKRKKIHHQSRRRRDNLS